MKHFLLLLTLCLCLNLVALAQEHKAVSYQLRFSPLALVDPNTPVLQLGGQVNFQRFAFSVEFGGAIEQVTRLGHKETDSLFLNHRYYKIRSEAKYFLAPKKDNGFSRLNPYLGLEGFWVPRRFRRYNDVIRREDGDFFYTYSDVSRNVLGGCLKFGLEPVVYKKWVIDAFIGAGIRRLSIGHQPAGRRPDPYSGLVFITRADQREGTSYRPHLAAGFKVGYVLR
jgi:hypothetical protein